MWAVQFGHVLDDVPIDFSPEHANDPVVGFVECVKGILVLWKDLVSFFVLTCSETR